MLSQSVEFGPKKSGEFPDFGVWKCCQTLLKIRCTEGLSGHRFIKTPVFWAVKIHLMTGLKGPGGLGTPLRGVNPEVRIPDSCSGGSFRNPNHQTKPLAEIYPPEKKKLTSAEATSRQRPERKEAMGDVILVSMILMYEENNPAWK